MRKPVREWKGLLCRPPCSPARPSPVLWNNPRVEQSKSSSAPSMGPGKGHTTPRRQDKLQAGKEDETNNTHHNKATVCWEPGLDTSHTLFPALTKSCGVSRHWYFTNEDTRAQRWHPFIKAIWLASSTAALSPTPSFCPLKPGWRREASTMPGQLCWEGHWDPSPLPRGLLIFSLCIHSVGRKQSHHRWLANPYPES